MGSTAKTTTGTSAGAEWIARGWAKRRANLAAVADWFEHPICLCGCSEALARHHLERRQRRFKQGHDAKLRSMASQILRGELGRDAMPEITRLMVDYIPFLEKHPELRKAF